MAIAKMIAELRAERAHIEEAVMNWNACALAVGADGDGRPPGRLRSSGEAGRWEVGTSRSRSSQRGLPGEAMPRAACELLTNSPARCVDIRRTDTDAEPGAALFGEIVGTTISLLFPP